MSAERVVYSIQRTYILNVVSKLGKPIITCNQRIDIPTIEPLLNVKPVLVDEQTLTVIPCIELVCEFLSVLNLTFETNEGVTVLPIKIAPGQNDPLENPYSHVRYLLVLPKGTTGIKTCKITAPEFGQEVQHNFTFGIMPPPYNYDNALFGYYGFATLEITAETKEKIKHLRLKPNSIFLEPIHLPKGAGKQIITIGNYVVSYQIKFNYPLSQEPTTHKPKITLHGAYSDFVYTLSLNKTANTVLIDLFTGIITAYDSVNGEIIQQFVFDNYNQLVTLSFENFNDIDTPYLTVLPKEAEVR